MVAHQTFTVGTSAFKIAQAPTGVEVCRVYVTNHDNAAVYVGGSDVSTANATLGFTIVKDSNYDFELTAGDSLYAISDTSAKVTVMILNG